MTLEIGPVFRAMRRNKIGFVLSALQIAITIAVILNIFEVVQNDVERLNQSTEINMEDTFHFTVSLLGEEINAQVEIEEDLRRMRDLPNVVAAVQTQAVPLTGSGWSFNLSPEPFTVESESGVLGAAYFMDEYGVPTMDLEFVAGRNFSPHEVVWHDGERADDPHVVILSQQMAELLFPDSTMDEIVGKPVYSSGGGAHPITVIGILNALPRPWLNTAETFHVSFIMPRQNAWNRFHYLVRSQPGARDSTMLQVEELILDSGQHRILQYLRTLEESYSGMRAGPFTGMVVSIVATALLIFVTALGVLGLTSYTVRRRTRQVGMRRALGASRFAIVRYFLVENSIVAVSGITLGVALGIGCNMLLVQEMEFPQLQYWNVVFGVLIMWALVACAALAPASMASTMSPAVAARAH